MALYEFSDVQLDVAFTKASSKAELTNLDNISTIVGKIAKWYDLYAWSAWTAPTVEVTGSGNAVTSASYGTGDNANKLTLTLGGTFLTQHPVIPVTTDTTSAASPAFGSTFTAVDSVSRDANGHVTTLNTKTVTIPNKTMGAATSSAAGTIGLVPAPAAGEQISFLRGDGTWAIPTSTPYTAGTGLVLSGMTFNHSNSVTAVTTASLLKFTYDAQGHITGSSAATSSDLPSHTHTEGDVLIDKDDSFRSSEGLPIVSIPFINTHRANKFAFMKSDNIQIEYTTDGGTTWNDGGYTAADKASLFIMRQIGDIKVGPNTSDNRTTQMQTRITLTFTDRDAFICKLYIWFSTNGHQTRLDIEYANASDPSTFIMDKQNVSIDGWSGGNIVNISNLRLKTSVSKIRLTFRTTSVNTNATYINRPSVILDIQAFGKNGLYAAANSMMGYDHLYSWDVDKNATFPAEVKVPTQLRVYNGNYGALFRTDGTNTHILLTNSGEAASGSWSALRPFSISNSTGLVTMKNGVQIDTGANYYLTLNGTATASMAYNASNPRIRFSNGVTGTGYTQTIELGFTDYDSIQAPASLYLTGNQGGEYFISPNIRIDSNATAGAAGNLTFKDQENVGACIRYKPAILNSGYSGIVVDMRPSGDQYGYGLVFGRGHGGLTIVGGGESANVLCNTIMDASTSPWSYTYSYGSEDLILSADQSIVFVSGANGLTTTNHTDWTHLKTAIFDADGYFKPSVNLNGSIGTAGNRWLSMYAKRYFGRLSQQVNLTRQTTANLACEGTMSMQLIQATSSMTTGKPALDGYILDFDWDNTGAYKAQLSIPNTATGSIQWRPQAGYTNWDNDANIWRYIHDNTKGVGKTGFLAYPTAGSYYEQTTQNITGALVITLPFAKTNGQCMIHFSVDIYNYNTNQSVTYVIAGYCYNDEKWYQCTAYALGRAMSDFNNLVVRFGCVTNGKYKIQIGETTTVWKYPQVSIRDVTVGYKRAQDQTTYAENIGNWTVTFESSDIANVTQTITYTRQFLPFDVATGSADANTFLDRTGWFNWNTTTGSNMPTTNYGILLSKENPSVQVFIPDNATGIYFRRRANTTATPTAWWGITGTAGTTYDLNNLSGKYALVVDETSDFASYAWHKFAEITLSDAYADASITFLVSKTWGDVDRISGILTAHVRTSSTKVYGSGQFGWLVMGNTQMMDPTEFVMVYTNTASTSCKVELWHKQTTRYDGWIFKVLKEHSRTVYGANPWTLFKHNSHGSATYTAGTGTIVSTVNTIANTSASANKINTDAGDSNTPVYFSNGVPVVVNTAASGANFNIVPQVRTGDGVMEIGRYIDFHSTAAGTTDYDIRLDASSTSLLTMTCNSGTPQFRISGTLPRLSFKQTTSGSAYESANCGITAYPANTSGVNLVIQGAGNMYIGGGESATAMYTAVKTSGANPYTNLKRSVDSGGTASSITPSIGNEKMFITSDEQIFFAVGANGLSTSAYTDWTHLKTVLLDSDGFFRPSINNKGQIGTSDYKWKAVHSTEVVGNAVGKDGFIAYPEDGTFSGNDPSTPISCITITLPIDASILITLTENRFFKVGFKVDIWAYGQWPETSDTLTIAGLITKYDATLTWFAGTALSNCYPYTVSFGFLNSKAQIQILVQHGPELYTPEIRIRDVVISDLSGNHTTFAENKSGWIIESNSNFPAGYVESAYIANSSLASLPGFVWNDMTHTKAIITASGALIAGKSVCFFSTWDATIQKYELSLDATTNTVSAYAYNGDYTIFNIKSKDYARLSFQTTKSGKAYTASGIIMYPLATSGMTALFSCGGNMVIGGGEFATNAYARKNSSNTTQVGYDNIVTTESEKLYLGADTEVQIISNAGSIATYNNNNHKVWKFQTDGTLVAPGLIECAGRKLITPFAIQTGSSKRQKITLQTLMTWLITTKKYIHSGIYEHVVLQTTWVYADNDILRLAVNGINYEMDLAGTRIEYIGSATSYNAGEFTLKIISPPTSSFTSTSGYTKFPPATIAVYTCNGSKYNPVWRMIMNGACGQPKIFESTDNLSVLPMPIEVTGLFTNWKVLLAQCTRLIYGGGDECSSFQVIIPLEYLKSLGTSGEMHIPLPFTIENNPIGRNYMKLKYVNDNKFTIGYYNGGTDTIGGRGLWTMYGMY